MVETLSSQFDVSDISHRRIAKYGPQFLGRGGQNLVYELPSYPDLVVKVDANILLTNIEQGSDGCGQLDRDNAKERITLQSRRFGKLREFFRSEHTLSEQSCYLKIPVNQRIICELYDRYRKGKNPPSCVREFSLGHVWSMVSIQEKAHEVFNPDKISMASGYAERYADIHIPEVRDAYHRLTTEAVSNVKHVGTVSIFDFAKVYPRMEKVFGVVKNQPRFKDVVCDFLSRAIQYTNTTGETLDLVGEDNVVFVKDSFGEWTYKLIDALHPSICRSGSRLKEARSIIYKVTGMWPISGWERSALMNTLNYVRTVNGMANWLGMSERLNIVPDGVPIKPDVLLKAIANV